MEYEPSSKSQFHSLHEADLYKEGSMVMGKLSPINTKVVFRIC